MHFEFENRPVEAEIYVAKSVFRVRPVGSIWKKRVKNDLLSKLNGSRAVGGWTGCLI